MMPLLHLQCSSVRLSDGWAVQSGASSGPFRGGGPFPCAGAASFGCCGDLHFPAAGLNPGLTIYASMHAEPEALEASQRMIVAVQAARLQFKVRSTRQIMLFPSRSLH